MPADRTPPPTRSAYHYFKPVTTRWHDNDVYGHVNNVVYYGYIDTVVNAYMIEAGVLDIEHGETIGLVVETGCRFHKPLVFPQPVTAGLAVARIGTSSVRYEIGMFGGDDDEAAAHGFLVHVYVDKASRRPKPLPETFRTALEKLT